MISPLNHFASIAVVDVMEDVVRPLVTIIVIGAVAIGMLVISLRVMEKVLPFSVKHELEEDHNVAAAIVMGSIILGVSIVIAAVAKG
ncbi:MAG: DUF350 domain-containing protein [Planctomycetota bacterium]